MKRDELTKYLDTLLEIGKFSDVCPNGLQVEGRTEVKRIVAGVTASQAFIDAAIATNADAILVHHGWFWRGEDPRLIGLRKTRVQALLKHEINLYAYHLPLDAHAEFGNNAQLAKRLGFVPEGCFGEQNLAWHGVLSDRLTLGELENRVAERLLREPLVIGKMNQRIERVAWCSGGAQSFFEQAIAQGVDAFLTGEISEQHVHLARESGVAFIAAGHHATERYGARALVTHLAEQFEPLELSCQFIDIDSPV